MRSNPDDCVAVIGLAGRFPGALDVEQFWQNLDEGREALTFPSDEELLAAGVSPRLLADPRYVRAAAQAPGLDMFDAGFFGFTPRDATVLDPQIRLFLEVAHSAIEHAGYDPYRIGGEVGVFGTAGDSRYREALPRQELDAVAGGMAASALTQGDYLSTHLSYRFGFRGPSLTVSTACSSSAVAVHLACQALRTGECDVAVAGGAAVEAPLHHGYRWDTDGPLSRDGHVRPFDARANGTVFGMGGGAVVLKRLSDALADRDHIWAVVRASAMNNDGAAKAGFSAPSVAGQVAVIREAMTLAEVTSSDVSYVEAHATGTLLGDPIEVAALSRAYRSMNGRGHAGGVVLSSVKGNVGHLGHAAGVTSLIKLALCLEHGRRAATVNFADANPRLELDETPFTVSGTTLPWDRRAERPRVAAMSSLGIGGTNVHLIVQEGPDTVRTAAPERPRVVIWSARDDAALHAYEQRLAARLRRHGERDFADMAGTLQDGRTPHSVRAALVARSAQESAEALHAGRVVRGRAGASPRPVAFLFPGQGTRHTRIAAGLYGVDETFSATMDTCLDLFAGHGLHLRDAWLSDDEPAQPLLLAVEYALAAMWAAWGIEPAVVVGHSLGELTAATVAGVFDLPSAVRLVAARAEAMAAMPRGRMLAVAAPVERIEGGLPDGVSVAVVNGLRQTVLAGAADRIEDARRKLRSEGIACTPLATAYAFHSPLMTPAVQRFAAAFDGVTLREPIVPLISATTGERVTSQARDPMFWAEQIVRPVRFDLAMTRLLADEDRVLLEVGPGRTLTSLVRAHPSAPLAVPTLAQGPDHESALAAAATLWAEGHELDWPVVRQREPVHRTAVPGYPYRRARHWPEARSEPPAHEPSALTVPTWVERPCPPAPAGDGTALVLLPHDTDISLLSVAALRRAGHQVAIVRPGPGFAEAGEEFRMRPGHDGDLDRVLSALAARGAEPGLLVHALALAPWEPPSTATVDDQLVETYHSLTSMAQRAVRRPVPPRLLVLAGRSADVTGGEPLDPAKATLHGAVRTLSLEAPELGPRLIDVAHPASADELADAITGSPEPVIAVRGSRTWVRTERAYRPRPGGWAVRRDGVYVLTGGLGGLGLVVARGLARTGARPTLVLAGRSEPAGERQRREIAALESMGARVSVEKCDVTDRRAVRRLFDLVRARHGEVNGVVHLAGVPGDGMLLVRPQGAAEAVLRPKVHGTLALVEALDGRPMPDFVVFFSSRAALGGLVGGADYAAANAFMDAQAAELTRRGIPALSLNWPSWHTVGMAAGGQVWKTVLDPATCPILAEHRIGGVPTLPGTGHLDLAIRAFRETVGPPGTPVRLDEVVFRQMLSTEGARELEVSFRPQTEAWAFEIRSRPPGDGGPTLHVTGSIRPCDTLPSRLDPAEWAALLKPLKSSGEGIADVGPRWDNQTASGRGASGELFVELDLPPAFHEELTRHAAHPALLDNALSAARVPGVDEPHLPFRCGSLELYGDLPARVISRIRRRRAGGGLIVADVDVYGGDGRPVAGVTGYTMREVDLSRLPRTPDPAGFTGLDPDKGERLFMALLEGRHPYQVAIAPHQDGRPVRPADARPAPLDLPTGPVPRRPADGVPEVPPNGSAPRDEAASVRERLAALWTEVLGHQGIDADSDFFELGGNSLTAVELMSRIRDEFGVQMSIVAMFDHPTVGALAESLTEKEEV
ncbi:SDR family NAD(P)-dependent oxidoreductase [Nonomuraea purpurea]|uniref:SDR family NAD(P)-dependent oxidoreductase n=1 Tax=Nonomuraea purpurea TaxID=1849276 RepID=A0ABV8GRP6_9ACTN